MNLTTEKIESAFNILGAKAIEAGRIIDIGVYNGSSVMIAYDLRYPTKVVDVIFDNDKNCVRQLVAETALALDLPSDWLTNKVSEITQESYEATQIKFGSYPSQTQAGLRVFMSGPAYFFAMKCIEIRSGASSLDVEEVKRVTRICNIKSVNEAMMIMESFYPAGKLSPQTSLAMEEIFRVVVFDEDSMDGCSNSHNSLLQPQSSEYPNKIAPPPRPFEMDEEEKVLMIKKRPTSFEQAARWVNAGYLFGNAIGELVDELKKMSLEQLSAAMNVEPEKIVATDAYVPNQLDAYLAAAAEHLARSAGIRIPIWTTHGNRFLSKAWFTNGGLISINAILLAESPLSFRRRFIFTDGRPLRRA